jgi:hypothetical protein
MSFQRPAQGSEFNKSVVKNINTNLTRVEKEQWNKVMAYNLENKEFIKSQVNES